MSEGQKTSSPLLPPILEIIPAVLAKKFGRNGGIFEVFL
jgi:hypothetical protein